jgi:hypothetical protein
MLMSKKPPRPGYREPPYKVDRDDASQVEQGAKVARIVKPQSSRARGRNKADPVAHALDEFGTREGFEPFEDIGLTVKGCRTIARSSADHALP